jgi:WXG100 family type VII secretion target
MPAPRVRADHQQLAQLAQNFGRHSEAINAMQQNVKSKMQVLESRDWVGKGATKFYNEMNSSLLPSVKRLGSALARAKQVTLKISKIMQQAEDDAAALFKGGAAGGGAFAGAGASASGTANVGGGGGFLSQVGGFFEGVYEGAKGMVGGLYHMVTSPIETLKGIGHAITHPGELWDALKKPYVEDWQSGNYGRAIGRGAFEVAMLLIPGVGEAKAVGKAGEAAELANIASKAAKAAEAAEAANALAKGARAAEAANAASKAAEVAEVAASIAKNQRIAMEALAGADKAADAARAADVFTAAQKAAGAPGAAEAISTFKAVDATAMPGILDTFGGGLGKAGDIPAELASRRVTTVGRLTQTEALGEAGARILKVPGNTWSQELNALWMKEAANNGDVIKLATEVANDTKSLAGSAQYGGISVYARELQVLKDAGYTRVGDFLIPPL